MWLILKIACVSRSVRHVFAFLQESTSLSSRGEKEAFQQISYEVFMAKMAAQNPECQICGKEVSDQSELEDHIVESHPDAVSPAIRNRYNQRRRCTGAADTAQVTDPNPGRTPAKTTASRRGWLRVWSSS
jgi:hypothetical protein